MTDLLPASAISTILTPYVPTSHSLQNVNEKVDLPVSRTVIHRSIRNVAMFLADKSFNNNTQVI